MPGGRNSVPPRPLTSYEAGFRETSSVLSGGGLVGSGSLYMPGGDGWRPSTCSGEHFEGSHYVSSVPPSRLGFTPVAAIQRPLTGTTMPVDAPGWMDTRPMTSTTAAIDTDETLQGAPLILPHSLLPKGCEAQWEQERWWLPPLASSQSPRLHFPPSEIGVRSPGALTNSFPIWRRARFAVASGDGLGELRDFQQIGHLMRFALAVGPVAGVPSTPLQVPPPPKTADSAWLSNRSPGTSRSRVQGGQIDSATEDPFPMPPSAFVSDAAATEANAASGITVIGTHESHHQTVSSPPTSYGPRPASSWAPSPSLGLGSRRTAATEELGGGAAVPASLAAPYAIPSSPPSPRKAASPRARKLGGAAKAATSPTSPRGSPGFRRSVRRDFRAALILAT